MSRFKRLTILTLLLTVLAAVAQGDTLVLRDGREFKGTVSKNGIYYTIKLKVGNMTKTIHENEVLKWIKDAPAADANKPTVPLPRNPKAIDPRMLDVLINQGQEALAAEDYKAARDSFLDALVVDSKNVKALRGAGASYAQLKDFFRAAAYLEAALSSTGRAGPDRALAMNLVAADVSMRTPMKAVKIAANYLNTHPEPLDEPMLNAMAIAMGRVDETDRRKEDYKSAQRVYDAYNARLEATRKGQKRWGVKWLSTEEAKKKLDALARAQRSAENLLNDLTIIGDNLADAKRELERRKAQPQPKEEKDQIALKADIERAQRVVDKLERDRSTKRGQYESAMATAELPALPRLLDAVTMDIVSESPAPTAVATATPPPAPAVPTDVPASTDTPPATPEIGTGETKTEVATTDQPASTEPPAVDSSDASKTTEKPADSTDSTTPAPAAPTTIGSSGTAIASASPPPKIAAKRKRVTQYAAAFPIAPDLVVTASAPLQGVANIELQTREGAALKAELVKSDDALGLAILRITGKKLAHLNIADTFTGGSVLCASYPTIDIFDPKAELIAGDAPAPIDRGWKINLQIHPRLSGAPLLRDGKIVGVEMATRDDEADKVPAVTLDQLKKFVEGSAVPAGRNADPALVVMQLVAIREKMD